MPWPPLLAADPATRQLERSWSRLDQQLKLLDGLLPPERQSRPAEIDSVPPLPANLLRANQPAGARLNPSDAVPVPPLELPTAVQLQSGGVQGLSLKQAVAIAFAGSATLQAEREQVAASLASLQAALGAWWPRISAGASGSTGQNGSWLVAPVGNGNLGFGPQFAPNGAFYVPSGGGAYLNESQLQGQAGLELDYALLDFARTPRIQAARAQLRQARNNYAANLRSLQLQVSEA